MNSPSTVQPLEISASISLWRACSSRCIYPASPSLVDFSRVQKYGEAMPWGGLWTKLLSPPKVRILRPGNGSLQELLDRRVLPPTRSSVAVRLLLRTDGQTLVSRELTNECEERRLVGHGVGIRSGVVRHTSLFAGPTILPFSGGCTRERAGAPCARPTATVCRAAQPIVPSGQTATRSRTTKSKS